MEILKWPSMEKMNSCSKGQICGYASDGMAFTRLRLGDLTEVALGAVFNAHFLSGYAKSPDGSNA